MSQTSGHGDWRKPHDIDLTMHGISPYILSGEWIIADGVGQTLMAVRENLKLGATQIKIMGAGAPSQTVRRLTLLGHHL